MFYPAKLMFSSYKPLHLEKGMLFLNMNSKEVSVYELKNIPQKVEEFLIYNGYPIELYIKDVEDNIVASPQEIGWMDEGDDVDELRDITIKDINRVLNLYEGELEIDMKEEIGIEFVPNFIQEKVVIRFIKED